jgi:hypothetical protein
VKWEDYLYESEKTRDLLEEDKRLAEEKRL